MHPRPPLSAAALLIASVIAAPAAGAGTVAGKVELPADLGEAPVLGRAYLPRLANPLAPARPLDPLPAMVVVLEPAGGAPAAKPTTVTWDLRGDSFARPVVAARLGDAIEIRNQGRGAPVLVARGAPQLLPKKPLNPTDRVAFTPTAAGLVDIVDEATPHLRGRAIVLERGLYAYPDAAGKFELADVPAGDWTVRVYYAPRNLARGTAAPTPAGWIERADDTITVGSKRTDVTVKLPPALPVKP
ncbi:MAG: hypothetical protein IPL61_02495 [Myxococcales bacterium]|nr:hypothetical protein [Myxococcales bacterium]